MGLQVLIALITAPFVFWLFGDDPPQQGVSDVAGSTETLAEQILVILAIAVAAPIIEEIIYRGMLLSWLRRRMSKWWAILVSAAVFAVIHAVFDPSAIAVVPGLFLLGVVLAYTALRTGDLSLPIALHSGINLLAALSLLYGDRLLDWAETRLEEMEAVLSLLPF
jgi:membrane protease YdiL (CAAX protease family)